MEPKKNQLLTPYSIALGVIALAFLAGITAGCLMSVLGGETADGAIAGHLEPFAGNSVPMPSVGTTLLNTLLYPSLCFLFGFAIPGVALIPLTVCARGFFLAYAASSCVRVFGAGLGTLFSFSLFGLPLLLSLPCLFWIGTNGLLGSYSLLGSAVKKPAVPIRGKDHFLRFGIALCALAVSAAVEILISPMLASYVAAKL
jgi:hypothetical protein